MKDEFDVVILGAGSAGATYAKILYNTSPPLTSSTPDY